MPITYLRISNERLRKIIKYTMTILRRQLIMNKPYILKDQYKPNLITPECNNIPRIADFGGNNKRAIKNSS